MKRFKVKWGKGKGVVEKLERMLREEMKKKIVKIKWRNRVKGIVKKKGSIRGVKGDVIEN